MTGEVAVYTLLMLAACDKSVERNDDTDGCAGLTTVQCARATQCAPLLAQALDEARECKEARTAVGCIDISAGCDESLTYARDSDGRTWEFPTTCISEGWTAFQPKSESFVVWGDCSSDSTTKRP
jgi:hypothetical protein